MSQRPRLLGANLCAFAGATLAGALVKGADCTAARGLTVKQREELRRGGAKLAGLASDTS